MRKVRSWGRRARNFLSSWPEGVLQSISPLHQFSVEVMLASAAEVVEGLLNEAVLHFRILAELPGKSLVARAKRPLRLAVEEACCDARFAPRPDRFSIPSKSHWSKSILNARRLQPYGG